MELFQRILVFQRYEDGIAVDNDNNCDINTIKIIILRLEVVFFCKIQSAGLDFY